MRPATIPYKPKPGSPLKAIRILSVVDLGDDPSTVVCTDGDTEDTYPCTSGYPYRAVGDAVLVVQLEGGAWTVIAKVGADGEDRPPTIAEIEALIPTWEQIDARIPEPVDPGPKVNVEWGTAAPAGSGWVQPSQIFFRTTAGGDIEIYGQLPAPQPPPTPKPPPPPKPPAPAKIPAPVTITSSARGAWRTSGGQDDGVVKAGAWTGANWYGAWFFGDAIANACAGKTVTKIEVTVARADDGSGWNRGVPVHLGLHDRSTRGRPALTHKWTPGKLSRGGSKTFVLPSTQRNALVSGDAKGVGAYGSGQDDYLTYAGQAKVRITFG